MWKPIFFFHHLNYVQEPQKTNASLQGDKHLNPWLGYFVGDVA